MDTVVDIVIDITLRIVKNLNMENKWLKSFCFLMLSIIIVAFLCAMGYIFL